MFDKNYQFSVVERFIKYAKIDTKSDEEFKVTPSTAKQFDLAKLLVEELKELGLTDAEIDDKCYVMATLPSNTDKNVPTIGFISHVDTSPAVTGTNVNPQIHKNYQGGDLEIGEGKIIDVANNPELNDMHGMDIITTDGKTLLGADDKAGIAEIMDALAYLQAHPEIKHGTIRIGYTPDEEIGRGADYFDVIKFGAKFAYTIDGSTRGEVETETFSADAVEINFIGINVHPGYAKDKMVNSLKVASHFIHLLPKDGLAPEKTSDREGYVHPVSIVGNEEKTIIKMIIRDFIDSKLEEFENKVEDLCKQAVANFPGSSYEFKVIKQYRNMKNILDKYPEVENHALESLKRLGIKPIQSAIRGGTDGSRLSFMGLPTPNLFAGGHNFHAYTEYVAIQDMEASVMNIVTLIQVWEEGA